MAMQLKPILLSLLLLAATEGRRVVQDEEPKEGEMSLAEGSDSVAVNLTTRADEYCCCKKDSCTTTAENGRIYSPNYGLCCRKRTWNCWVWWSSLAGYSIPAPSDDFCEKSQDKGYTLPEMPAAPVVKEKVEEGSAAHTVDKYCHIGVEEEETDADAEVLSKVPDTAATGAAAVRRNAIISELVQELSKNSIDTMAKEIFSIYVCVRWVPNDEFQAMAQNEIDTEQLPQDSNPYKLYASREFIPLRCSRNVNVYDLARNQANTHFKYFESSMLSIADWLRNEDTGEVQKRIKAIQDLQEKQLRAGARAFDLSDFQKVAKTCTPTGKAMTNVRTASGKQLLENCEAAKWWYEKLEDWQTAFPFASFMSPDKNAALHAPKATEQVLVCFGKRVASQLHRREGGGHLLTDQSAVGCHGFWDLPQAADMLRRTVWLWRPPTCQLARMELDMKLKIMDLIADMNTQLFDAMPAMLLDELEKLPEDQDLKPLQAKGTMGKAMKIGSSVFGSIASAAGWLFGFNKAYQRLGMLLGNTVVKWAVCPLKPLSTRQEENQLDSVLGAEDDTARYYAEKTYAKWTLKENSLPGEACSQKKQIMQDTVPRCYECSIGIMRENMPEPYQKEDFVCPVRPLLPAKQQLQVFEKKDGLCLLHMTHQQWLGLEYWMYRGRSPHKLQYNLTENNPTQSYEIIKIIEWRTAPDTEFGLWRDFATYGRRCTEEELAATPRWCEPPAMLEDWLSQHLQSAGDALSSAASSIGRTAQKLGAAVGVGEAPPTNKARGKRLQNWAYGLGKKAGQGMSGLYGVGKRANKRYEKLRSRLFAEVEAGELLHSASFQEKQQNTRADSTNYQKFDRYGVVCPCPGFDPAKEFRLKYTWAERALRMLSKGQSLLPKNSQELNTAYFTVETQAASALHMEDNLNAWQFSYAIVRAYHPTDTRTTSAAQINDVFFTDLVGADAAAFSDTTLYGFSVSFICGQRKALHDLGPRFGWPQEAVAPDFAECVRQGIVNNRKLRKERPNELFFADETVVLASFGPVNGPCVHESFTKDSHMPAYLPVTKPEEKPERYYYEAENDVYTKFRDLGLSCAALDDKNKKRIPDTITKVKEEENYRGLYVSTRLPPELLVQVLLDVEDVKDEVKGI